MGFSKSAPQVLALLLLAGCGGGGGGGGGSPTPPTTPPPATPPGNQNAVFVIPATVTLTADAGVGANPIASVDASTRVELTDTQRGAFTMTENGLEHVYFSPRGNLTWETIFYFKDPSEIGPGVYVDTVRVGLCTDVNCTALQEGTTSTVTITYTVTGTPQPPPGVTAAASSASATAMAYSDDWPRVTIPLTYLNERANRSFSATTSSGYVGTLNSFVTHATPTGATLEIVFRQAYLMQPGVYDDVITVDVCSKCPTPVEGSPLTIHTRYTVTDTADGPNGYRIRLLPQTARELAWDSHSERLYMAVPTSAAANASSLIAVNPQTGAVTGSVSATMDPSQLAVSADGRFAYVGSGTGNSIRRFKLPELTDDIGIALGSGPQGPRAVREMEVSPYDATLLSVERQVGVDDANRFDIGLVSNGVLHPYAASDTFGRPLLDRLQWADATHLYGNADDNRAIGRITIAGGAFSSHVITPLSGTVSNSDGRTHWDGTYLYRDNGEVVDVAGGAVRGVLQTSTSSRFAKAVAPDAGLNRAFVLVFTGLGFHLQSFALDTMQPLAQIPLVGLPFPANEASNLIRFGTNGLAVSTSDGRVLLIEGAFVSP